MSQPKDRMNVCAGRPYGSDNKKQWIRVGELTLWADGGISIRLDAVPTANWFDGNLKCFPADEQRGGGQQRQVPARNPNSGSSSSPMAPRDDRQADEFRDDDIPF